MPRLKPAEVKRRATILAKTCIKNRLNQSAVARELGISHQAVNEQVNKPAVQDKLQEFLDSPELDQLLLEVAKDGLVASKPISAAIILTKDGKTIKAEEQGAIEAPDHSSRHRFWHDCMIMKKKLKDGVSFENHIGVISSVAKRVKQIERQQVKSRVTSS